ncbi:MAG: ABC transporter substrate-binding protein [Hydrogenophaga sp.]|nr:ABC transporter substrate-binding protein [Hydrogenophaga sp.]
MKKMLRTHLTCLLAVLGLSAGPVQAEEGVDADQILIGENLTLQGGKNDYGTAVLAGVQTAFAQVNRSGGVRGRKLALKVLDDNNKSDQAEANARQLVQQDKVFILFGSIEGGPSTAVMRAALDLKVPFFGPMAGSPAFRQPYQPLVFPVRSGHKDEFLALMRHARSLGMTKVAFVRSDSENGRQHLANVQQLAKDAGVELVSDLPFKSDISDAQLGDMARQIRDSGAQMVFNHGGIGMYEKLIRQSRQIGVRASFYGVNSGSYQLAKHLGDLAHGMIFAQVIPSPWERKTALTRAYQDAFSREQAGIEFSYGSLEGYLTARSLIEALKRAGPNPTRESFLAGLRNSELNVEGLKISYREGDHVGSSLVDLAIVTREGRFRH